MRILQGQKDSEVDMIFTYLGCFLLKKKGEISHIARILQFYASVNRIFLIVGS
jgi:hypothetical protein